MHPDTKFAPLIVNGCALLEPTGCAGLTLVIEGAAAGAFTLKLNWPVVCPSGLITSTVHVWATVVKVGLIVMDAVLKELMGRLA